MKTMNTGTVEDGFSMVYCFTKEAEKLMQPVKAKKSLKFAPYDWDTPFVM